MMLLLTAFAINNSRALVLNCNFQTVNWSVVGSSYTCTGSFQTVGDVRNVTGVTGNHLDGRNNSDVTAIAVSSQLLMAGIPREIENFFPNLAILSFSYTNILQVTREDLKPFPHLRVLILFNNRLEKLDSDLFVDSPNLQYINLSQNRLRHLGPGVFKPLNNLSTLRLLDNICINQYVDGNIFEIITLLWDAQFRCPSSVQQLENEIFSGNHFTSIIEALTGKIEELEERVRQLEGQE